MERCVNIDWLEIYALESMELFPCDANYFRSKGYFLKEREYGTRVYAQMFTIIDERDRPLIEIRRKPYSVKGRDGGFFPPESCHIRLANSTCYRDDAVTFLREFMAEHKYTFKKIYRLDVCLDFELFDRGDEPNLFLQRFMKGRYSKVNQANISAHGVDQWNGRLWNSVSWGNPKSMVSTKLYCKSLELAQVKDKPYIRQAWHEAHLIDDPVNMLKRKKDGTIYKPDIWRVEFSVKSSGQKIVKIDKNGDVDKPIILPHTLSMYDTKMKLLTIFASLAQHYFHFKIYEPEKRKDRCEDKVLFDFSALDTFYKIDRLASHTAKTKPMDRLIVLLQNFYTCHPIPEVGKPVNELIEIIESYKLKAMYDTPESLKHFRAMQLAIRNRLKGNRVKDAAEELRDLETMLQNNPELF